MGEVLAVDEQKLQASLPDNTKVKVGVKAGDVIVRVDPRYFRPTEVETLLGDASKAHAQLGWTPRISFEEMVGEMVRHDLMLAAKDDVIQKAGFTTYMYNE